MISPRTLSILFTVWQVPRGRFGQCWFGRMAHSLLPPLNKRFFTYLLDSLDWPGLLWKLWNLLKGVPMGIECSGSRIGGSSLRTRGFNFGKEGSFRFRKEGSSSRIEGSSFGTESFTSGFTDCTGTKGSRFSKGSSTSTKRFSILSMEWSSSIMGEYRSSMVIFSASSSKTN